MMARTQIALENEMQRRALQRASDLGVSFAEYVRRLVSHDLARPQTNIDVACIFDLGHSNASDIAVDKRKMIAEAFQSAHRSLSQG
jgi:hypothetical protein